jgi:hypothetical protein
MDCFKSPSIHNPTHARKKNKLKAGLYVNDCAVGEVKYELFNTVNMTVVLDLANSTNGTSISLD